MRLPIGAMNLIPIDQVAYLLIYLLEKQQDNANYNFLEIKQTKMHMLKNPITWRQKPYIYTFSTGQYLVGTLSQIV